LVRAGDCPWLDLESRGEALPAVAPEENRFHKFQINLSHLWRR
jgi:hypothetical protein